ncbi:hypothetical protein I4F81_004069 [Pyropia yezoensis]|uniref:Uncharacterized protein n=1 Tax=Pyropia yezoensis TaxID=2788 RepID=A0ACC3BUR8_PYRYE|nr:hypothetical protein I4F81_004069 [Neopyropia yezoensis]
MTVTRVAATVVFLGLQFLPTLASCGRAPYRSVLLAPLTWALALTFSFTAMWECEYDTLSLNLLFGGATGVFMGNQFSSDWHRRPRDWATRLVGSVLLLLYVVVGSLVGTGRLVESYGPRICQVATSPPSPPLSDAGPAGDVSRTAAGAAVYRCLMAGALVSTLYGWSLDVDLEDPRNVAFAFATVRTRDWAVLSVAVVAEVVAEVVAASVGVAAFTSNELPMSWEHFKHHYLPVWPVSGCLRWVWGCCRGRGLGGELPVASPEASDAAAGGQVEGAATPLGRGGCAGQASATDVS